jgi:outer membrane lipoprotein LolB
LLVPLLVLSACTTVSVKEPVTADHAAYQVRADMLGGISEWSLSGKISLDDGNQGGSGKLQWLVHSENSEIDFHGALGRGAWHLKISPGKAILKESNGSEETAAGVNALIQNKMGWPIPVEALQWWVRGVAAPGLIDEMQIDAEGLLISLSQFGWRVNFSRYDSNAGVVLPVRLDARLDDYRVKLAISRWQLDLNHASTN